MAVSRKYPEPVEIVFDNGTVVSTDNPLPTTGSGGGGGGGGGGACTIADGADVTLGAKADSAATTDTGTFSLIALTKRGLQKFTTLLAALPAALTGSGNFKVAMVESTASQAVTNANLDAALSTLATQTTAAAIKTKTDNLDVALSTLLTTSDFDTKVGALTETAPATDTASSGLNGRLQRIAQRITSLIALVPTALTGSGNFKVALTESTASQAVTNANLDAALSTLLTTSDFDAKTGALTETAPATDTASSGLNGRLQRIAQRLTSLIALVPTSLGAKTAANSFAVTLATDDESIALTGAVTETAPATDTASSGLNGRLQRIAQRITSLIALLPSALVNSRLDVNVGAIPGTVSTANSSAATLTSGSVFTGTSEDVSGYSSIVVNIFADQAGTFAPQFSSNGTNWDFAGSMAITASTGAVFVFRPTAKFFRIVYTNGGTNQGAFRMQAVYHQAVVTPAVSQALAAGLTNPTTYMVGANLMVQTSGGTTWAPAAVDSSNRLSVVALADGYNRVATATLTRPANTTAYASGDEMTDTGGGILQFSGCGLSNGGGGIITGLVISSSVNAATKPVGELRLYDTTSTPATDNAAFDSSDGVNDTAVAVIPFGLGSDGLTGTTGNSLFDIDGLSKTFKCAVADTKLYGRVILKAAYTSPANSDTLKFTLRMG